MINTVGELRKQMEEYEDNCPITLVPSVLGKGLFNDMGKGIRIEKVQCDPTCSPEEADNPPPMQVFFLIDLGEFCRETFTDSKDFQITKVVTEATEMVREMFSKKE